MSISSSSTSSSFLSASSIIPSFFSWPGKRSTLTMPVGWDTRAHDRCHNNSQCLPHWTGLKRPVHSSYGPSPFSCLLSHLFFRLVAPTSWHVIFRHSCYHWPQVERSWRSCFPWCACKFEIRCSLDIIELNMMVGTFCSIHVTVLDPLAGFPSTDYSFAFVSSTRSAISFKSKNCNRLMVEFLFLKSASELVKVIVSLSTSEKQAVRLPGFWYRFCKMLFLWWGWQETVTLF